MKTKSVRRIISSATITILSSTGLSQASAQTLKDMDLFSKCPLKSDLRVADARSVSEFESLGACHEAVVDTPRGAIPEDSGVVRIQGVKAKPVPRGKRAEPARDYDDGAAITTASWSGAGVAPRPYDTEITRAASTYRIDPLFLHAIIHTESAYRPRVVSHAKAVGLMQILPSTGTTLGVQKAALYEPATNIDAGARLLKRLQRRYGSDFARILSAYNAGEGAVARYGGIPPYRETRAYVGTVMGRYQALRVAAGAAQ